MAMLSGCALAHAEKPVDAVDAVDVFSLANPYDIHQTAACWNPIIQPVATVQRGRMARPLAVLPVGPARPALSGYP